MALKLYNTLTRSVAPFEPEVAGQAHMYCCGPTVYNYAHLGNFRAYIFEDLLRRYLQYRGYKVTQIMNLTDVDDKTIRGARETGQSLQDFTRTYKDAFFSDLGILNIEPADEYPAATDHIPEMIALIERILEAGCAYVSDDGSIYFNIEKFADYGQLARLDKSGMLAGARVAHDEYNKESLADFALWKAWQEDDGDITWDSPWGRGRPGWHIECSAMSMKFLGESFDIHTGGVDNIFPHHENEIAQSGCTTGKTLAKWWLHCAHLIVDGRKMSKSAGNFYTLRDLLDKGCTGRELRYALMSVHYRHTVNFTMEAVTAARAALERLDTFHDRLVERADGAAPASAPPAWLADGLQKFRDAMDDDLNISGGLAALFDAVHEGNRQLDAGEVSAADAAAALAGYLDLDRALGCLVKPAESVDADATALAQQRQQAREAKDWAEADRLRDELAAMGWAVKDTAEGPKLRRL